jgi:hypothetical protein
MAGPSRGTFNRTYAPRRNSGNTPARVSPTLFTSAFIFDEKGSEPGRPFAEGRGKYDPAKDFIWVYLMHDIVETNADGTENRITAEFSNDGEPMTRMKLFTPESLTFEGGMSEKAGKDRRSAMTINEQVSAGKPMKRGSQFTAEKHIVKDGEIHALYLHGGPTAEELAEGLKFVYPELFTCVLQEEKVRKIDPVTKEVSFVPKDPAIQRVMSAIISSGVEVHSEADLKDKINEVRDSPMTGSRGYLLQARKLAPEGATAEEQAAIAADPFSRFSASLTEKMKPVWAESDPQHKGRPESYEHKPVEELVKEIFASAPKRDEEGLNLPSIESILGDPAWQVEFIPVMVNKQSKNRVPSRQKDGRDDAPLYMAYDDIGDGKIGPIDSAWIASTVFVERKEAREDSVFYCTYAKAMSNKAPIFVMPDMPTYLMPDYHLQAVTNEAARLGQQRRKYFNQEKAAKTAAATPAEEAPSGPAPR